MNEKMKLAIINEIVGDFIEFGNEEDSTERKLGRAEGTLDAINAVVGVSFEEKDAPAIDCADDQIDPETGGLLL